MCRREFRTRRLAVGVSQPCKPNSDDADNFARVYILELNIYDNNNLFDSDNSDSLV